MDTWLPQPLMNDTKRSVWNHEHMWCGHVSSTTLENVCIYVFHLSCIYSSSSSFSIAILLSWIMLGGIAFWTICNKCYNSCLFFCQPFLNFESWLFYKLGRYFISYLYASLFVLPTIVIIVIVHVVMAIVYIEEVFH